jgi:oxygen-dependent protoporphyrinogen oxidase
MSRVVVVGAGLSGLAAAWYLVRAGVSVSVVEAGERPGGLIQTQRRPEGLVETAARAFPWNERTAEIFAAAGVPPTFAQEESRRRYIFRDGRPRRWPLTAGETAAVAARFGGNWIARRARPRAGESVAVWGARVLGTPALTWLLAPALQGIYASPPDALSAVALFGKRRARRGRLAAPPDGMSQLIDSLHRRLEARGVAFELGRHITSLDDSTPSIICTNAPAAARLLASSHPEVAASLGRIRMVSLVIATAFFPRRDDDLRGFGVLFPRGAGIDAMGAMFNTDMFAGRGELRSETWIYALPAGVSVTEAAIVRQVVADRAVLTNRSNEPVACYVTFQIDALPVYDAAVLEAETAVSRLPRRLAIAGNYTGRLGVSALLDGAADAAARVCQNASTR